MKVAINGFGRIGKNLLRAYFENGGKEKYGYDIVAVNNRKEAKTLAHLFKYDSCYGTYHGDVQTAGDDKIIIDGHEILLYEARDPEQAPWKELGVGIVLESTGKFKTGETAGKHITAEFIFKFGNYKCGRFGCSGGCRNYGHCGGSGSS